mmetsp:Transcript_32001/g.66798  ORF Transcript_32001/g.66798 Transcript_32001/m.66798 type:complete len:231 (+) Transcript_32001:2988-3680(+)
METRQKVQVYSPRYLTKRILASVMPLLNRRRKRNMMILPSRRQFWPLQGVVSVKSPQCICIWIKTGKHRKSEKPPNVQRDWRRPRTCRSRRLKFQLRKRREALKHAILPILPQLMWKLLRLQQDLKKKETQRQSTHIANGAKNLDEKEQSILQTILAVKERAQTAKGERVQRRLIPPKKLTTVIKKKEKEVYSKGLVADGRKRRHPVSSKQSKLPRPNKFLHLYRIVTIK